MKTLNYRYKTVEKFRQPNVYRYMSGKKKLDFNPGTKVRRKIKIKILLGLLIKHKIAIKRIAKIQTL